VNRDKVERAERVAAGEDQVGNDMAGFVGEPGEVAGEGLLWQATLRGAGWVANGHGSRLIVARKLLSR
jgi:hypothetical protein